MINISVTVSESDLDKMLTKREVQSVHKAGAMEVKIWLEQRLRQRGLNRGPQGQKYWAAAARSTKLISTGDFDSEVSINHKGVCLIYHGGTIRPTGKTSEVTGKPTKSLLIPLENSPLKKMTMAELLLKTWGASYKDGKDRMIVLPGKSSGLPYLAMIEERKKGDPKVTPLAVLRKQAIIKPHPDVLPEVRQLAVAASYRAQQQLDKILTSK